MCLRVSTCTQQSMVVRETGSLHQNQSLQVWLSSLAACSKVPITTVSWSYKQAAMPTHHFACVLEMRTLASTLL